MNEYNSHDFAAQPVIYIILNYDTQMYAHIYMHRWNLIHVYIYTHTIKQKVSWDIISETPCGV